MQKSAALDWDEVKSELLVTDDEVDAMFDKVREPGDLVAETNLLDVIRRHRYAIMHGIRYDEFDKVTKYLNFQRKSTGEKIWIYTYRLIGVGLVILLLLALI